MGEDIMIDSIHFYCTLEEERKFLEFILDSGYIILQKTYMIRKKDGWYEKYYKRRSKYKTIYLYEEGELKKYILDFYESEKITNNIKLYFMKKYDLDFNRNSIRSLFGPFIILERGEDYISDKGISYSSYYLATELIHLNYEISDIEYVLKPQEFLDSFESLIKYIKNKVDLNLVEYLNVTNNCIRFEYDNLSNEVRNIVKEEGISFRYVNDVYIAKRKVIIKE